MYPKNLTQLKRFLVPGKELILISRNGNVLNEKRIVHKVTAREASFELGGNISYLTFHKAVFSFSETGFSVQYGQTSLVYQYMS